VSLAVPGSTVSLQVTGRVAWRRTTMTGEGPPGMGVEFHDAGDELGKLIDTLIAAFRGMRIALICPVEHDRELLGRLLRTALSSAEITDRLAGMVSGAPVVDLLVVDMRSADATRVIQQAKNEVRPLPIVALAADAGESALARAACADEGVHNPPVATDFQRAVLRALMRPLRVQ
jgi:CheY-like chemotaxis protein